MSEQNAPSRTLVLTILLKDPEQNARPIRFCFEQNPLQNRSASFCYSRTEPQKRPEKGDFGLLLMNGMLKSTGGYRPGHRKL